MNILLVEDNASDAFVIKTLLHEFAPDKFRVTHVDRLDAALDAFAECSFDAMLLDLFLSDAQGLETLERARSAHPEVPIIALSSVNDPEIALHAVHDGAQDYFVKGRVDGHAMTRIILYAIERTRIREELRKANTLLEQRVTERTAFLKVTIRRLHEEIAERKHTEDVLRKERDFSAAILDTVSAVVVVLDTQGRIVRVNHHCETLTGYREDEVRGKLVWDVYLPSDDAVRVAPVFQELVQGNGPNKYENHWRTKSGKLRMIAWSNTVLRDEQGVVEHVIATGIDITERRRAEELERQRMLELAHVSRLSTMGEMATEIAHELNQPLCAIASYADTCVRLIEMQSDDLTDVQQALREIAGQAERASEVVRRIRKFVRKEGSERVPINVNEIVQDVVKLTRVEARWRDVLIHTELIGDLPEFLGDKILIEQVLLNLVRNAIEAMEDAHSEERRIDVVTQRGANDAVEICVSDSGPGLSEEALAKIFQPFYTTKASGMGMGLSISQSIVKAHGGRLWAERGTPNGVKFHVELPMTQEEDTDDTA